MQIIENAEGEVTPEVEEALALTFENLENKAVSYAGVVRYFDYNVEVIEKEIERLTDLKKKAQKHGELFKSKLDAALQQFGIEKIETPTVKIGYRKSEAVEITDETAIPAEFIDEKVTHTISKTRLKAAIKEGRLVSGAELRTKKNIQIK